MTGRATIAVIGVGNVYRTDDGAGVCVARALSEMGLGSGVRVIEEVRDGTALMDAWQDMEQAFVIDCVVSGAEPGTVFRFEAATEPLPAESFASGSTHTFSVAEAVELARTLNRLPPSLIIYGIEGENFSPGLGLTSRVTAAAHEVARRIMEEIRMTRERVFRGKGEC